MFDGERHIGRILWRYAASQDRRCDELLNGEIFYTLREAQIVIESWRRLLFQFLDADGSIASTLTSDLNIYNGPCT